MTVNQAYQQILTELHQLNGQIMLKLPASPVSVQRQVQRLKTVQIQLEAVQERVCLVFGRGGNSAAYWRYCTLIEQMQQMDQKLRNFRLLGEEYPVDPEGTTTCLQSFHRTHSW